MGRLRLSGRSTKALVGVAVLGACVIGIGTRSPVAVAAQGTTYYFHGTSTDDVNRLNDTPTATFNVTAPTGTTDQTQTGTVNGSSTNSADKQSAYWLSTSLTGTLSGTMHFDWWWSSANAEAIALGDSLDISVWADVTVASGTVTEGTGHEIGSGTVAISMGATPVHSVDDVTVNGTAATNLVVQATVHFVDSGNDNRVHYDSLTAPSSFIFPYVAPPPPTSTATVAAGNQGFANYGSPPGFQTRDGAQRQNSGEPSIGVDRTTGKVMYMAGTQVSQIGFSTSTVPPTATWNDVTPAQLANLSEDSILFTNATTNRTWAEDFLLNPTCNANMAFTDTDGGPGGGPTNPATNTSWTPSQCPFAQGPDHPSVGAGPYHGTPPTTATDKQQVVYYCAQNVLVVAGAECSNSTDGGLTWNAPAHIFGATTPCDSIHGHIRVSPDGTMYVPQGNCGGKQGMALTQDNGTTFTYAVVPDAVTGPTDPSVAADANNTIYFGYQAGAVNSQPKIAISHDHGTTWGASANVGTPFGIQNAVFPEVIAGATGRAAFAFLGTTTGGDYQLQSFTGVWYLYVAYTYDGGNSWQVVNATPFDPVQRGCVDNGGATGGTYGGCRNMLDFNDITLDTKGRVYVAYTDGCTTDPNNTMYNCDANPTITDTGCATSPGGQTFSENASEYSTATCTYGRQSALVRQVCGQGLFATSDPGFFEGPACANAPNTPEAPLATALVVVGGGAAGLVGLVVRRRRRGRIEALTS
ncbi:MAG TPA: sialidase family protein [Candidatus Acidoferrales bacterium]|nr:sialidase family protein [Candidatus Acidoferrales bacterium]